MHISDQVKNELHADGWEYKGNNQWRMLIANFVQGGMMSNGDRVVTLDMDPTGRWFSRIDGWGNVQKDVDLREVRSPQEAIEKVLAE